MKNSKLLYYLAIAAVVICSPAVAFSDASVQEGKRLGLTCAGCHGTGGYSPGEYIGRIAGQNPEYMAHVLTEFAAGKRPQSVEMSIIAKGYSTEGLTSMAMYYGAKKWENTTNEIDPALAEAGRALAAEYSCADCHGENGGGAGEVPHVAGQNKGYLYEVMKRYRAGAIQSDEMSMMTDLSDKQLEELANYMADLR